MRTPDAMVLGGGGILGEAWMSAVLAGLDESKAFASTHSSAYLGTSAGSIVAASLAAGVAPGARLGHLPEQPQGDRPLAAGGASRRSPGLAGAAAASLASLAFHTTQPGGALLRRTALRRVPRGAKSLGGLGAMVESMGARWDGRLRITAVDLDSGRRVIFGAPGAPTATVASAVEASCAIPGVFKPVSIGDRAYVDGGAWSPTNLDAVDAPSGSLVLCLNPTGSMRATGATLLGALGSLSRAVAGAEALALRHRGYHVDTVDPDRASAAAMGLNLMDGSRREQVIAAGLAQGRSLATGPTARAA